MNNGLHPMSERLRTGIASCTGSGKSWKFGSERVTGAQRSSSSYFLKKGIFFDHWDRERPLRDS